MAINACTIDGFTINSKSCADKFAVLIPILHPTTPPPPGPEGGFGIGRRPQAQQALQRPYEIEDREPLVFEQPDITVTAEFMEFTGSDTQSVNSNQLDFVTITNFEVDEAEAAVPITVNITDLKIE